MIIICPECHTKFRVEEDLIPEEGIEVRCSKCQNVFSVAKEFPADKLFPGEETPVAEEPEPMPGEEDRKRPRSWIKGLTLAIVLAAVAGGLYFYYGQRPGMGKIAFAWLERIPFYFSSLSHSAQEKITESSKAAPGLDVFKQFVSMLGKNEGVISVEKVRGYYLETSHNNKIFVIEGQAVNHWRASRSFIRVKGTLLDSKGNRVKEKVAYCGNVLLEKDLKELSSEAIDKSLSSQFGESFANVNIPPGKSVPFMIVFTDLSPNPASSSSSVEPAGSGPPVLSDFAVEVIGSQKGSR